MKTLRKLYKVQSSSIHKRGIFAAADIEPDERIIRYLGEKITKAESERRAQEREQKGRRYGSGLVYIFELNKRYDIDGYCKGNIARYINHSCDPNCEAVNIRGEIWIVAKKRISKGEELSYDYGYDLADALTHPCNCGTSKCVGYIVRADKRSRLKQMLKRKTHKSSLNN